MFGQQKLLIMAGHRIFWGDSGGSSLIVRELPLSLCSVGLVFLITDCVPAKPLRQTLPGGSLRGRQLRCSIDFKAPDAGPAHNAGPMVALGLPWSLLISQLVAVC